MAAAACAASRPCAPRGPAGSIASQSRCSSAARRRPVSSEPADVGRNRKSVEQEAWVYSHDGKAPGLKRLP
eukprot:1487216-Pyramimonas_sp.AAC.1